MNQVCIDCGMRQSEYAVVWLGIYVCEDCALTHLEKFGMKKSYVKHLFYEQWDDQ